MDSNFQERSENISELTQMLDTITNQKKEDIKTRKTKSIIDITKHSGITFSRNINGEAVTVTQNIYEVLIEKDDGIYHEFYDDQNKLLASIPDNTFEKGKELNELGLGTFDENSLEYNIYNDKNSKSLSELENEQSEEISKTLGIDPETAKELDIFSIDTNKSIEKNSEEAKAKLEAYMHLGTVINTNELATSDETIKEFLNTDADKLLALRINGTWSILKVKKDGSLEVEKNLEAIDNNQTFSTVDNNGNKETRMPEIEFRRKDMPDYSLAIDSTNTENDTRFFLVAGNSRSATEIEANHRTSPYADAVNNELVQKAQENPDSKIVSDEEKDPHEPAEPELSNKKYY